MGETDVVRQDSPMRQPCRHVLDDLKAHIDTKLELMCAQTSKLVAEEVGELFMDGPITRINEKLSSLEGKVTSLDTTVRDHVASHNKPEGQGWSPSKELKWFGIGIVILGVIIAALLGVDLPFLN